MQRFNRQIQIEYLRNLVRQDMEKGGHSYYIMVDKRNGDVVLMNSKSDAAFYTHIGKVKTSQVKNTKKNINALATQIHKAIAAYNKTCYITYSRAVSEYGKKNVIDEAFVKTADNPYYKCAGQMRLYDKNIIQYHIKSDNYEEVSKRENG